MSPGYVPCTYVGLPLSLVAKKKGGDGGRGGGVERKMGAIVLLYGMG